MSGSLNMMYFLKTHYDYFLLSISRIFSAVGCSFTSVVVYGTLEKAVADSTMYTIAYLLTIIPGVFVAKLSHLYLNKIKFWQAIIITDVFGIVFLYITYHGIVNNDLKLLLSSLFSLSLITGFISPFLIYYDKERFTNDEMKNVTFYDSITFSIHTFIGVVIGSIVYLTIGYKYLLLIDFITYFISSVTIVLLVFYSPKAVSVTPKVISKNIKISKILDRKQKFAFYIGPILSVFGFPIMSVGPILVENLNFNFSHTLLSSSVLILISTRAMGQLIGSILAGKLKFDKHSKYIYPMVVMLALYLMLYYMAYISNNLIIFVLLIFFAHIISNQLFMVAYYAKRVLFPVEYIASLESKSYITSVIMGSISALVASQIISFWNIQTFFEVYAVLLFIFTLTIWFSPNKSGKGSLLFQDLSV